jgi:hypothetical protein
MCKRRAESHTKVIKTHRTIGVFSKEKYLRKNRLDKDFMYANVQQKNCQRCKDEYVSLGMGGDTPL